MDELRHVGIFSRGDWKPVLFKDTKKGNKFRMGEDDGTPVVYKGEDSTFEGITEWIADSEVYENADSVLTVNCAMVDQDDA